MQEFDDGHDDVKLLGVFSSQQKAENALVMIKNIIDMQNIQDQLEIYESNTDLLGWTEGFITIK